MVEQRRSTEDTELSLYRAILASLPQGLAVIRAADATVVWVNDRVGSLLGRAPAELLGRPASELLGPTADEPADRTSRILAALGAGESWSGILSPSGPDGAAVLCRSAVTAFEHPEHGLVWLTSLAAAGDTDTSVGAVGEERTSIQRGIILPGRGTFQDDLMRELSRARRTGQPVCVAMLSVDGELDFAQPETIDVLSIATVAWRGALRDSDSIAYYDFGDFDYVALLPDCAAEEVSIVAERARTAPHLDRTCSAGFACWNREEDGLELSVRAHRALQRAQREGGDRSLAAAGG